MIWLYCNLDGVNPLDRNSWRTSVRRCLARCCLPRSPGQPQHHKYQNRIWWYDDVWRYAIVRVACKKRRRQPFSELSLVGFGQLCHIPRLQWCHKFSVCLVYCLSWWHNVFAFKKCRFDSHYHGTASVMLLTSMLCLGHHAVWRCCSMVES